MAYGPRRSQVEGTRGTPDTVLDREGPVGMRLLDDAVIFLGSTFIFGPHLVADADLRTTLVIRTVAGAHVFRVNTPRLLAVRSVDVQRPVLVRALDLALHPLGLDLDLDAVALAILRLGFFGFADVLGGHVALALAILKANIVGAIRVHLLNLTR